jgi:hypothetical protein
MPSISAIATVQMLTSELLTRCHGASVQLAFQYFCALKCCVPHGARSCNCKASTQPSLSLHVPVVCRQFQRPVTSTHVAPPAIQVTTTNIKPGQDVQYETTTKNASHSRSLRTGGMVCGIVPSTC